MKKVTTLFFTGAALLLLAIPHQAKAATFTYADSWVNWPGGYNSAFGDEHGTPKIDHMVVTINENSGHLDTVSIFLHDEPTRQSFDSLFISTGGAWDSWDYFVHDGGDLHANRTDGTVPGDGLYSVINSNNYDYTLVKDINRIGNPNGIDNGSLTNRNSAVGGTLVEGNFGTSISPSSHGGPLVAKVVYDFTGLSIDMDPDHFFVAYAPWCANDIIGGGTAPVPEPATMLLFGTGLAGLATVGRKKLKRD